MKSRVAIVAIVLAVGLSLTGCKSSDYKKALGLQEAGNYQEAVELFRALGDYQDSTSRAASCNEYIDAIQKFDVAVDKLNAKNEAFDTAIKAADAAAQTKKKALDETLKPALETAVLETKAERVAATELPRDLEEIAEATEHMEGVDYTDILADLNEKKDALVKSIKQYELVDNPSEAYVASCLKKVPGVVDMVAATEENDPNGQLHKAGGYTSAIFFSHENIDQMSVFGDSLIDKGTDAGGQVEVYATPEDAAKRNAYLSGFDGLPISSGAHQVVGTCIVRVSREMTATQQKEVTANVIEALIKIK